jgi:hypothetical protein
MACPHHVTEIEKACVNETSPRHEHSPVELSCWTLNQYLAEILLTNQ